jgi:hypothetical protein
MVDQPPSCFHFSSVLTDRHFPPSPMADADMLKEQAKQLRKEAAQREADARKVEIKQREAERLEKAAAQKRKEMQQV